MKYFIALLLAFSFPCLAEDIQPEKMHFEVALVEISREEPVAQRLQRAEKIDSVIEQVTSGSAYRTLYRPLVITEVGTPGVSVQTASESFPVLVQSISASGGSTEIVMGAMDEGYSLTITPERDEAGVVTAIRLDHSVKVGSQATSQRRVEGASVMQAGDYQVFTWPNNGKLYALIVRLAKVV